MDLGLKQKNAVITASTKGIGKAVALSLFNEGCNVCISSSNEKNLQAALENFPKNSEQKIIGEVCDLNNPSHLKNLIEKSSATFGSIDILVNNCGGPSAGMFDSLDEEKWNYAYQQVLMSAMRLTKIVLPFMIEKKWGRIINVTSISVKQPIENLILSNTFRTGLTSMMKTLSTQYAKEGITINCVAPGYTLTERIWELAENKAKLTGEKIEEIISKMNEEIPAKRMATPEEIASMITFLASEKAAYITGNTIHIDGGVIRSLF